MPNTLPVSPSESGLHQIGDQIKESGAAAVANAVTVGSMGIMGAIKQNIGNMTAMGVICCLFVWLILELSRGAREDRIMFREAIEKMEVRQEARSNRAEMIHGKALDKMGLTIERAVTSLERATEAMNRKDIP